MTCYDKSPSSNSDRSVLLNGVTLCAQPAQGKTFSNQHALRVLKVGILDILLTGMSKWVTLSGNVKKYYGCGVAFTDRYRNPPYNIVV